MTQSMRRRLGLTAVIVSIAAACGGTDQLPTLGDPDEPTSDGGTRADATSESRDANPSNDDAATNDATTDDATTGDAATNDGAPDGGDASDASGDADDADVADVIDATDAADAADAAAPDADDGSVVTPPDDAGDAGTSGDAASASDADDGGGVVVSDAGDAATAPDADDGGDAGDAAAAPDADDGGSVLPPDDAGSDAGSDAGADASDAASSSTQEAELAGGAVAVYGYGPGNHVSITGDTIAIGSPGVSTRAGQVEMYRWSTPGDGGATSWNLEQNLTASDADSLANFGTSVDLDPANADHLIVGDIWGPTSSMGPTITTGPGEAFIFTRSGTTWTQTAKLACPAVTTNAQFGYAVALSGKTAAVGWPRIYAAPGYTLTGMVSIFTQGMMGKWTHSVDLKLTSFASDEFAGTSLALVGSTLLVGAPGDWSRANGSSAGRVEIFTGSGNTWTSLGSLTASDGVKWDQFGWSVAQSTTTNTIVVGAPSHADSDANGSVSQAGAAYVFVRSGNTWTQQAELVPPTPTASGKFGYAVAAAGDDRVIVGAPGTKELFLYTRSGTTWNLTATYTACNSGGIGASLAASGNLTVSAASNAWVFDLADPNTACVGP